MPTVVAQQGHPELADIFRVHGPRLGGLSAQQRRVIAAITSCRTAALGGHLRECDRGCGYHEISYNSCRDRHCPKCQGLARVRWQEARAKDLLPVPYFHLVFTIPGSLHDVFLAYPRVAYGLLFEAVEKTVREVAANPKNLGAQIGMTAILHTWTQTLLYHPHLHCIVPGGGLDASGDHWIPTRENFFLAVRILSTVFRAKLLAAFANAVASGKIAPAIDGGADVSRLLRQAARRKWVVYCKRPFAGPKQVLAYLGRYTHRIAISNERIVAMSGDQVTFFYKDRADSDRRKQMTLSADAFLRRFLLHVLPAGFVRIRHYGLLANAIRHERIARCRELLGGGCGGGPAGRSRGLGATPPAADWRGRDAVSAVRSRTSAYNARDRTEPLASPGRREGGLAMTRSRANVISQLDCQHPAEGTVRSGRRVRHASPPLRAGRTQHSTPAHTDLALPFTSGILSAAATRPTAEYQSP